MNEKEHLLSEECYNHNLNSQKIKNKQPSINLLNITSLYHNAFQIYLFLIKHSANKLKKNIFEEVNLII